MRHISVPSLVLLTLVVSACTATPQSVTTWGQPSGVATAARLAVAPPLLSPDGQLRLVATLSNEVRAEEPATGSIRWTLPASFRAAGATMHWRLLVSDDGSSIYVQSVADGPLTYLGTRRVDARTGVELANDIKFEIYWYENVVLWTALTQGGRLQMAIERAPAAGGGYWLRTFDPLTLKMLTDTPQAAPPAPPSTPRT